ncbi:MAG: hypothetical protein A2508_03005 [Candidatus Lambdaproteobacteria bacterium RIFOXYD12_FULL_49_8]|uniref:FecR protein domain-containing protein n=1 Tax=Candidatus Lambdaproteobacteria bacterium RIFOXYD2_FULL_50_16 TaxID=1817772 RepID=A0A1F6GES6_9PROT|nr:MAG: hypothetical protein A2527_03250 [Candidatus Lambdaproteobacteria bacterium RIFOXYD2_FULL_50_16]OGG97911.1 MAG: hypothetical protein A2508_03005 [Candidatus Lambdaproteobacteria bacterium RIFOXYD12_FULL_49_8]
MKTVWMGLIGLGLFLQGTLCAAERLAQAEVKQGNAVLIRANNVQDINPNKPTDLLEGDLLRLGPDARATLNTPDGGKIELGANAIFQVEPWKLGEDRGYLKLVYGKALLQKAKLQGGDRPFRIRTSMAVIGVKGTQWWTEASSVGNTQVHTKEGAVWLKGGSGEPVVVSANQMSVVINSSAPTQPQTVTAQSNLNSSPVNSPAAAELTGEAQMIEGGLISASALEDSKSTEVGADESFEGSPVIQVLPSPEDAGYTPATPLNQSKSANISAPPIEIPNPQPSTEVIQQNLVKSGSIQLGTEF